jgi:manganese oxidase
MILPLLLALQVPQVVANDNRNPAGARRGDTLVLALEVRLARWFPEASTGPSLVVPVVAVRGDAPQVPAPLIRVSTGTHLDITVHNALADSTVTIHGLVTHPGVDDSVSIAPGGSRRLQFAAGAPGTYLYWMNAGARSLTTAAGRRDSLERDQMAGAFVVDSGRTPSNDRVLVINLWGEPRDSTREAPEIRRNTLTINGRAWPHSERLALTMGDSVRWRVVNASQRVHPMHLHGFYFQVATRGQGVRDSTIAPAQRRLAVTEEMLPRETRTITWLPDRPGNWLFHCHIAFHVVPPNATLEGHGHPQDEKDHMAGLVLGLDVRPRAGWVEPDRGVPSTVRFAIEEMTPRGRSPRTVGVAVDRAPARSPGPALYLTKDQPTDITVVNRLSQATAIHWHGLELESYSDGVVGWSGEAQRVAPSIAPGDSFVARLTQPRAGTFIYHTHLHDIPQLTAGLYGPLIVLEPGVPFDATRDHVFLVGWDGPQLRPINFLLNGETSPAPLELKAGVAHRLRLINIGPAQRLRFALLADSTPASWRPIGMDGATLPPARAMPGRASIVLPVGSTMDAEFVAPAAGEYLLTVSIPAPGSRPVLTQRLVVR